MTRHVRAHCHEPRPSFQKYLSKIFSSRLFTDENDEIFMQQNFGAIRYSLLDNDIHILYQ